MPNMYKTKVREALEIDRLITLDEADKTFKVMYRDHGTISLSCHEQVV